MSGSRLSEKLPHKLCRDHAERFNISGVCLLRLKSASVLFASTAPPPGYVIVQPPDLLTDGLCKALSFSLLRPESPPTRPTSRRVFHT